MGDGIGERFQRETKYSQTTMGRTALDWSAKPDVYKTFASRARLVLPPPRSGGGPALWDTISARRSSRTYRPTSLPLADLSQLLWAAQGVTRRIPSHELRAAPSAGALYPVETYLAVHAAEEAESGIYHYDVQAHALELLKAGDFREAVAQAALFQDFTEAANVVFIWTALFARSKWKYRERAYRYVYLDAGHIAQNVALAAVALGLGSCQIAAFFDDAANAILGVDGETESVLYMTAVGQPRKSPDAL
jgi:SagB-type dehydrogenase family enzyme